MCLAPAWLTSIGGQGSQVLLCCTQWVLGSNAVTGQAYLTAKAPPPGAVTAGNAAQMLLKLGVESQQDRPTDTCEVIRTTTCLPTRAGGPSLRFSTSTVLTFAHHAALPKSPPTPRHAVRSAATSSSNRSTRKKQRPKLNVDRQKSAAALYHHRRIPTTPTPILTSKGPPAYALDADLTLRFVPSSWTKNVRHSSLPSFPITSLILDPRPRRRPASCADLQVTAPFLGTASYIPARRLPKPRSSSRLLLSNPDLLSNTRPSTPHCHSCSASPESS